MKMKEKDMIQVKKGKTDTQRIQMRDLKKIYWWKCGKRNDEKK